MGLLEVGFELIGYGVDNGTAEEGTGEDGTAEDGSTEGVTEGVPELGTEMGMLEKEIGLDDGMICDETIVEGRIDTNGVDEGLW
jgi:hypothetical protein